MIYGSVTELIGNTPLLELSNLERDLGLDARIVAKLERFNPAGSVKDRIAKAMLEEAEREGALKKGAVIVEPTSGNTGIGLAAVVAAKGYRIILTMPETMTVERRNILKAYGAEIVLTECSKGMKGAIAEAERIAAETPGAFIPGQFTNMANPKVHEETTGPEIWEATGGDVAAFVAGVGTGGTLTGVGRFLKSKDPGVRVVAVEPAGSPVLSGGPAGPHGLQGIGAGFVPDTLDTSVYDEIIQVREADAYESGRLLARREGVLAGITSGAALWAAVQVAKRPEFSGRTVVALLPDTGERYLSSPMFAERHGRGRLRTRRGVRPRIVRERLRRARRVPHAPRPRPRPRHMRAGGRGRGRRPPGGAPPRRRRPEALRHRRAGQRPPVPRVRERAGRCRRKGVSHHPAGLLQGGGLRRPGHPRGEDRAGCRQARRHRRNRHSQGVRLRGQQGEAHARPRRGVEGGHD